MECLLIFFFVLFLLVTITGSAARLNSGASRRRKSYQQLARRFSGHYVSGGLLRRPSVVIRYGETRLVVREATSRGPFEGKSTQVQIDWADPHCTCEIISGPVDPQSSGLRGLQDVAIDHDHDALARHLVVRGQDPQDVQRLMSEGVLWQLAWLREATLDRRLYVLFRRGQILVQKPRLFRRFEELLDLVQHSCGLYDQAMLTRAVGIQFVDGEVAQTLDEVICKVCGEDIHRDMVFCRRCKTPHHRECWLYAGYCSVYGCQETEFDVPRVAARSTRADTADGES